MPPTNEPLARITSPPPMATTFGSSRMPLCGRPGCVIAASSVVSVRKLTAVAALPIAVVDRVRAREVVAQKCERPPAAVDHGDRHGVARLLAVRERGLRRLLRGGGGQRAERGEELLRAGVNGAKQRYRSHEVPHHRPLNTGLRFSLNARMPSW